MKIAFVTYHLNINGVNCFLINVAKQLSKIGYEILFITYTTEEYDYESEIKSFGGRIVRIDEPMNGRRLRHIKQLKVVLKEERPDIVHSNTYFDSANVMIAAKMAGIRMRISHSHTTQTFSNIKQVMHKQITSRIISLFSTCLLACSDPAGKALFGKRCFLVIPDGINVYQYYYDESKRNKVRKALRISNDTIVVGHVGKMRREKNHVFMLKILSEIRKTSKKRYSLVFVGSGKEEAKILNDIKKYGLGYDVVMLGDKKNVYEIINSFDLFILPSEYEGFSMALLEAEINGLPCIVSTAVPDEAVIKDVVRLPLGDALQWANAIQEQSLNRVVPDSALVEKFSINESVRLLRDIYEKE